MSVREPGGFLTGLVAHYGYPGLAVLVGVESFGVPAPGETAVILGAGYAAHGQLAIIGVAISAFLAAVTGDSIGYLVGRTGGRRIILRYGRYVRLTPQRFARLEAVMGWHGPKLVAVARFVGGVRQFNRVGRRRHRHAVAQPASSRLASLTDPGVAAAGWWAPTAVPPDPTGDRRRRPARG
ncbi:DedA family protein [Micromonospora sp. NPDC006431]|uniref:DedA family protein n=1 Tax=Micromonospora sp. NPDC006431 TaxID=3364235 RepID=UPI003688B76B